MPIEKKSPPSANLKAQIVMAYPALSLSFYHLGEMKRLETHDAEHNLSPEHSLANLPTKFDKQITKIYAAIKYIKEFPAETVNKPEYIDGLHRANARNAMDYVAAKSAYKQRQWNDFILTKNTLIDALSHILENAESAAGIIRYGRYGDINLIVAPHGDTVRENAELLVNSIMKEEGVDLKPPQKPRVMR